MSVFYMGTEDPNSDPYACTAGASQSELSPQPLYVCLILISAEAFPEINSHAFISHLDTIKFY